MAVRIAGRDRWLQTMELTKQKNRRDPRARARVKQRGFTLTELLVVVAIIAVVTGLGGGIYVGTYKRLLVVKTARDLLLTAKYARIMAIEQQRPYEIHLDLENNGFALATSGFNEETGATEQVVVRDYYCRPVEFQGDVKFEDIKITSVTGNTSTDSGDEQKIVFSPSGGAESAVIQIGDGKTHYTVSVCAATGKGRIHVGTADKVEAVTVDLDAE
ncbi:MAG: prepilin-type N-terminal cleavage/methylation domain-containing protein [Phycisphaerales bacterium]|nr:MAG: prepilin-type N-terminal cleavage/methylation domain-containing protein [Phycisphaerales bacterium]